MRLSTAASIPSWQSPRRPSVLASDDAGDRRPAALPQLLSSWWRTRIRFRARAFYVVSKALERVGDHATTIAEMAIFSCASVSSSISRVPRSLSRRVLGYRGTLRVSVCCGRRRWLAMAPTLGLTGLGVRCRASPRPPIVNAARPADTGSRGGFQQRSARRSRALTAGERGTGHLRSIPRAAADVFPCSWRALHSAAGTHNTLSCSSHLTYRGRRCRDLRSRLAGSGRASCAH